MTEEFFQRWAEAHEEHNVVELNATKASDREPWWTTAGVNVHPPGTSFERRLESTCDPARLSLYKPLVQRVCADMLLSSNPGSPSGGRRLVHKLSNADPVRPPGRMPSVANTL